MKRLFLLFALLASLVTAQTRTFVTYQGAWSSTSTYNTNDEVLYSGVLYVSLISSNLNLIPSSNPSDWQPIGSSGGTTTTNALTMNSSGSGASSGATFNGSSPQTISYNTIGAPGINANNTFTGSLNSFSNSLTTPVFTSYNDNNNLYIIPAAGSFDVTAALFAASQTSACTGSNQGCTIHIADGGYPTVAWSNNVTITSNNVHIICDSRVAMAFGVGYPYDALDLEGTNDSVEGCTWNVTNMSNHQVIGVAASNVRIHGITITDSKTPAFDTTLGIRLDAGTTYADVYDNNITVSYIAYSTSDNALNDTFHDNVSAHSFQCFDFNGSGGGANPDSYGITFHHNQCLNDSAPGYVESASDVLIDGNQFWYDGTTANGATIQVHNTLTTNYHLHVITSNNTFVGGSTIANAFHVFQNANDWSFNNNTVRGYSGDAVVVDSTSGTPANGQIANNRFTDNGTSGVGNAAIRLLQSTGNSVTNLNITGNTCIDDTGDNVQTYCLEQSGGGDAALDVQVISNYSPEGSAPITLSNFTAGCTSCNVGTPFLNTDNIFSGSEPIIYSGAYSFTIGSTSVVGTGATTPMCPIGTGLCSPRSGIVQFTTGTGTLTAGIAVTINLPTRTTYYVCSANGYDVTTPGPISVSTTVGFSGIGISTIALNPSSEYQLSWQCI